MPSPATPSLEKQSSSLTAESQAEPLQVIKGQSPALLHGKDMDADSSHVRRQALLDSFHASEDLSQISPNPRDVVDTETTKSLCEPPIRTVFFAGPVATNPPRTLGENASSALQLDVSGLQSNLAVTPCSILPKPFCG